MRTLAIVFLILAAPALIAQTVITKADMDPYLKAGVSAEMYETADGVGAHFNLGDPGAGKTWDFSGSYFYKTGTAMSYVSPSSTMYAGQFPTANLALAVTVDGSTAHTFFRMTDNALFQLGYTAIMNGNAIVFPVNPEEPVMQFPMKLGDTWTYNGDPVDINGHVFTERRVVNTVDADGTIKLPMGSYECVRAKKVSYSTQKVIVNGNVYSEDVTKSVSYSFITKSGITVAMGIDSTFENSSFPFLQSLSYTIMGGANPVAGLQAPQGVTLAAPYPNPVATGATVNVAWRANGSEPLQVRVYNASGQEVAQLFEGQPTNAETSVQLSTSALAPGMYFVRLTGGTINETQPFAVIR